MRAKTVRSMIGPLVCVPYLLLTWHQPHRATMLAVIAALIGLPAVTWWRAAAVARSGARSGVQTVSVVVNIAGSATLTLLDGGVAGPFGVLLPFSLLFYAVMMTPRTFLGAAVGTWVAYGTVAVVGGPAPPGYRVAGQCSALQGGGEGPRWEGRQARAVP